MTRLVCGVILTVSAGLFLPEGNSDPALAAEPLADTEELTWQGDLAARMVEQVDRFLLEKIAHSAECRGERWARDVTSPDAYVHSVSANRQRLARIVGVRGDRVWQPVPDVVAKTDESLVLATSDHCEVLAVRWPAVRNVWAEGLLLRPRGASADAVADIVAIPDADQTPEEISGLAPGVPVASQFARRLCEAGCRVLVPELVSRHREKRNVGGQARVSLTAREFLYRSGFELGQHLIGYEVQKVLAAVDWFEADRRAKSLPVRIGVMGYGEGGMIALYSAALDQRIGSACVSGYFGPREGIWRQPIDRNVFGLLDEFGDAELAALVAPRRLVVEAALAPEMELPGEGGAPAVLTTPLLAEVHAEADRAERHLAGLAGGPFVRVLESGEGRGPFGAQSIGEYFPEFLGRGGRIADDRNLLGRGGGETVGDRDTAGDALPAWTCSRPLPDPLARQSRQFQQIDQDLQWLLGESANVRQHFMRDLDTSSLERFLATVESYREYFRHEVIGHFDDDRLPPRPRSRKVYDQPQWTGYEVVLDVFPEVFAYGILLLPKDLSPGERRPVVVCQHGLEGRPQDVVAGDSPAYHDFAARLAERGYITFAPQNLYIGGDRFRTLQRKANPLKKTLFSIIVPQHQQIVDWLKTLPMVDPERIAFYGLSYGGKSAMRIPPLVKDYCLSICSADFNEWVWKNASSRSPYSYVGTGEYEIFEFNLGSTFNYAEMATLIAPRPFMVERGHFDGVAPDEAVAYEFAKVRHLYAARLGIGDRCDIEWFVGPHTIHGQGTFRFLDTHLPH
jgi:dienelactone hydrolase